jgi:FMN phosphatase YigB (HAD superfamily)
MDGIYGIEFMDYMSKPSPYPYVKLLKATGARAESCLFCEDVRANLVPARELGMFTVWVGGSNESSPAHAVVDDVCDLPGILPKFLEPNRSGGNR